jgi:hypothetical protein
MTLAIAFRMSSTPRSMPRMRVSVFMGLASANAIGVRGPEGPAATIAQHNGIGGYVPNYFAVINDRRGTQSLRDVFRIMAVNDSARFANN